MKKLPRLLIVDDEEALRTMLQQELKHHGYEVDAADGGEVALEKLKNEPFDLVILDIRMPDVDGMEVLRQIRENNIPGKVVMLTAVGELKYAQDSLDLGASDFMTKPVDLNDLLTCIKRTLAS